MNFITGIFQGFCLLFRSIYLKGHLWVAASVYFNRKASQGINVSYKNATPESI